MTNETQHQLNPGGMGRLALIAEGGWQAGSR